MLRTEGLTCAYCGGDHFMSHCNDFTKRPKNVSADVLNEECPDDKKFLSFFVRHGKGFETTLNAYNNEKVAAQYDKSIQAISYHGPEICADMAAAVMASHDRSQVKILDIGAGTGRVGRALAERGFLNITANDGAQVMIDLCMSTGLYNSCVVCPVDEIGSMPFANDTFDAVVSSGAFIPDHVPPRGIAELARVAKPGGFIISTTREEVLTQEYGRCYLDVVKGLQDQNILTRYGRLYFPNYNECADGIVDILKVH